MSSFYAEFDAWQREQAAANGATASSSDDDVRWIRGRVTAESGAPVAGAFVNAIRVEGETSVGRNQRAETSVDGTFAVRAPEEGDYRISVDINDDCTRYYSNSGLTKELGGAQPATVRDSDLQGVNIRLPANICGWLIRGRVVDAAGEPFAGASITICETTTHTCTWNKSTKLDGSFAISAPTAGEYRLRLNLADGCTIYYRSSGEPTLDSGRGTPIPISDSDVNGLRLQVPSELCSQQISGRLVNAGGEPLAGVSVRACRPIGGGCTWSWGDWTTLDGSFAFLAPSAGEYHLTLGLADGCYIYYHAGGLTARYADASLVKVMEAESPSLQLRVPEGMCAHRISGRLVDANGAPLVDKYIDVCRTGDCALVGTTTDGRFTIRVPSDDSYTFEVRLASGCDHRLEGRALGSPDNPVRVRGADVTGITLRLLGTVEELCG